jgi:RimJ/RimL family protein N-acetyltransferase
MKKQTNTSASSAIVFLQGKRGITLRPPSLEDVPTLTRWVNDPELRRFIKRPFPMTLHGEAEWIQSLLKRSDTDVVLVLDLKGTHIGMMGIHRINWKDRTANTGAFIGEKQYWGKGYGTDAKMVLIDYAFNTLGLRKLSSHVYAFNERSIAYSKHCGYVEEGRLIRQRFIEGEYHDEVILSLFKEQWLPYWDAYQKAKRK